MNAVHSLRSRTVGESRPRWLLGYAGAPGKEFQELVGLEVGPKKKRGSDGWTAILEKGQSNDP